MAVFQLWRHQTGSDVIGYGCIVKYSSIPFDWYHIRCGSQNFTLWGPLGPVWGHPRPKSPQIRIMHTNSNLLQSNIFFYFWGPRAPSGHPHHLPSAPMAPNIKQMCLVTLSFHDRNHKNSLSPNYLSACGARFLSLSGAEVHSRFRQLFSNCKNTQSPKFVAPAARCVLPCGVPLETLLGST